MSALSAKEVLTTYGMVISAIPITQNGGDFALHALMSHDSDIHSVYEWSDFPFQICQIR
jgi:hypothetical protein